MSARGFGPGRSNKAASVTPATVTGASNGLHLSGSDVQLGGTLSAATQILTGFNPLAIVGDAIFGKYDGASRRNLIVDSPGFQYGLGDIDFSLFGTSLFIDDAQREFRLWSGGSPMLWMSQITGNYWFGAYNGASNLCSMTINDGAEFIDFRIGSVNPSHLSLERGRMHFGDQTGHEFIDIDYNTRIYSIGDFNARNNGCYLNVNDNNNRINIDNTAHNMIVRINGTNGFTGTVAAPASITVIGGIVTNVV